MALACAAASQAVHQQERREPGSIRSVALPGLGANTGRVPVRSCANLMWSAYSLYRDFAFRDFAVMRSSLAGQVEGTAEPGDTPLRYTVPEDQKPA